MRPIFTSREQKYLHTYKQGELNIDSEVDLNLSQLELDRS